MSKIEVGGKAPAFKLPASTGEMIELKDFKDQQHVVLYFYPKDNTPGCTKQACSFRDSIKGISKSDAVVLGVSPDSVKKHNNFIETYELPFVLLSDEDKKVCKSYGVWVEKSMYGRKYMGVARSTFVIDKDGMIVKIFEKVKPDGHAQEVLEFLKTIN